MTGSIGVAALLPLPSEVDASHRLWSDAPGAGRSYRGGVAVTEVIPVQRGVATDSLVELLRLVQGRDRLDPDDRAEVIRVRAEYGQLVRRLLRSGA